MTKEQRESTIAALIYERDGFDARARGAEHDDDAEKAAYWKKRSAAVDKELRKLGSEAARPVERATRRPSQRASEQR